MSPYHAGELDVQRRASVEDDARRVGRILLRSMPSQVRSALLSQRLAIAASLDPAGRVWASLLSGPAGFLQAVDDSLLYVDALPHPADPLLSNLRSRGELGLLVIDPATRLRLRMNGRGMLGPDSGLFLGVDQVYGNCTKYIQLRRLEGETAIARASIRSPRLDQRQRGRIAASDTLFIASFHPDGGADTSHRGGYPGFVRVVDDASLAFPDYPGNNMFNTLGNLAAYPHAGLLFVDFASGDLIQLTGKARLVWPDSTAPADHGGQRVVVDFAIDEVLETPAGSGQRWEFIEYSPALRHT